MPFCLASAAAFGAMGIFGKLAYDEGATVGTLLATRFVLAAVLLWLLVGVRELRAISRRDAGLALLLGAVGYAAPAGGYFTALERLDASLLALLVYVFPVIVAVTAVALRRERASRRTAGALALSVGGLLLVLAGAAGGLDPLGTLLGLATAVVYSAYVLGSEGIAGRVAPLALSTLVCTGAAATLTVAGLAGGDLDPGARERLRLRLARRPRARLDRRRDRAVLRRAAAGGPDGGVDPVDARAGGHRRARVRRLRRVARARPARRRGAGPDGRARRPYRPKGGVRMKLDGKVALVTGATRGAGRGTAVALGEAGATVYCTGRSTQGRRSEYDRPETIEETASLVTDAGGTGIAVAVDHLEADQVEALVRRIDDEQGRLDVLVNDIWGGERLFQWNTPLWEHDLGNGLRLLRLQIETHLITSHFALPLLIRRRGGLVVEMTDGTREYNDANYREPAFYDLAKSAVIRLAFAQSVELAEHGCAAVALTPGWLRSEMMLEVMGVTEENWRDGAAVNPHFAAISESPRFVGRAVAALAADPDVMRRSGGSFSSGELAREYGFTDVDGSQPDCWRYMVEVQDRGLPADSTGYR